MNRREALEWLSRGMAITVTAIVGLPGIRYLCGSAVSSTSSVQDFQRLKRLQDLPVGRPVMVPILGRKQDGWVQGDQQVLGRVWLVRNDEQTTTDGSQTPFVSVFNSTCPHMGCQIQAQASNRGFVCPCHRAAFGLDGERTTDVVSHERNHAPRDMDRLDCRIVEDSSTKESWVEVKFEAFELGASKKIARS